MMTTMAEEGTIMDSIKWRRAGNVRPASTAAEKANKMKAQLMGERYGEWSAGQLFRMLEPVEAVTYADKDFNEHPVVPKLELGDVIMYLGWFVNEPWEHIPGSPAMITGPKWLVGDRVYLFLLDPEYLVPVYMKDGSSESEEENNND